MAICNFNSVKLVKGGTIQGDDKTAGSLTSSDAYYPFGASDSLWGLTLSDTDINASNFGVVFSFVGSTWTTHYLKATNFGFSIPAGATINGVLAEIEAKHTGDTAQVDHIKITVYYTEAVAATDNMTIIGENIY